MRERPEPDLLPMKTVWAALPVALITAGMTGCGGEEERLAPLEPNSTRVALTVDYPGSAPMALITYRSLGRRCHALGTLTAHGPRVLADQKAPLTAALQRLGGCLDTGSPVSVQVSGGGTRLRVAGGLASPDVVRVRLAGQRVKPGRGGAFLVAWPSGTGDVGRAVEVQLRDGTRRRVALDATAA